MSFRFNFGSPNNVLDNQELLPNKNDIQWFQSEEILPDQQIELFDDVVKRAKMYTYGDLEIGHVEESEVLRNLSGETFTNAAKLATENNSDLLPGKYEGGFKIWECTHDLIKYLVKHEESITLKDRHILDLGCGAGILGIYTFLKGSFVTFQDYNKEVLEYVTIPNMLLNIEEAADRRNSILRCKFYSGDWDSFNDQLGEDVIYDLILTSETIYNENNYDKLIRLFTKRLAKSGTIFVAAKTCYFGVGGGIRQFEKSIKSNNIFNIDVCWKNYDGIRREILKINKI
ncbi:hypothetical protein ACJJTC_010137 [Scirpophaga incertulas]